MDRRGTTRFNMTRDDCFIPMFGQQLDQVDVGGREQMKQKKWNDNDHIHDDQFNLKTELPSSISVSLLLTRRNELVALIY